MTRVFAARPANNRIDFDRLLFSFPGAKVQLSWGWGESRRTLGWEPLRYLLCGSGRQLPVSLQVKSLPLLNWRCGILPAAPSFLLDGSVEVETFVDTLRCIAQNEDLFAIILVVPLPCSEWQNLSDRLIRAGLHCSALIRPDLRTIVVDLKAEEKKLFQAMSSDHRRYVRRAMRAGITVRAAEGKEDFELFHEIYAEMCSVKGIPVFPRRFFRSLWDELAKDERIRLFLATGGSNVLGGTIVACEPEGYLLLFSAHRRGGPNVGASRLLEWEIILDGHRRGLAYYDLGGIGVDEGQLRTQAQGVAFWKLGFGGRICDEVGAFDLIQNRLLHMILKLAGAGQIYRHLKAATRKRWI